MGFILLLSQDERLCLLATKLLRKLGHEQNLCSRAISTACVRARDNRLRVIMGVERCSS